MEWILEFGNYTPESSMELLATMQPTSRFGEMFQYSNVLASAAGYAAAHVVHPEHELGTAYDKAMQSKVFDPLGMAATTFDYDAAQKTGNLDPQPSGRSPLCGEDNGEPGYRAEYWPGVGRGEAHNANLAAPSKVVSRKCFRGGVTWQSRYPEIPRAPLRAGFSAPRYHPMLTSSIPAALPGDHAS
jgi:CubicO group peptidase (beta-lactamase class C family)